MRTKTLLLSAAAFLAAGIVTSQAQVYSQNIVGYANINTSPGVNYLLNIPFAIGVSNGANEIWPVGTLPDGSSLLIWNSTNLSYTAYTSDSTSPTLWDDNSGYLPYSPKLPVGQGFFLNPAPEPSHPLAAITNTFAGTVAVNVGTSNNMVLAGGQYLVGCIVPYAGAITNGNLTTGAGGPCLYSPDGIVGLPDGSSLSIWNSATLSYTVYTSDSTSPSGWDDNSGYLLTPPTITVGQGFFLSPAIIAPATSYTWKVGL